MKRLKQNEERPRKFEGRGIGIPGDFISFLFPGAEIFSMFNMSRFGDAIETKEFIKENFLNGLALSMAIRHLLLPPISCWDCHVKEKINRMKNQNSPRRAKDGSWQAKAPSLSCHLVLSGCGSSLLLLRQLIRTPDAPGTQTCFGPLKTRDSLCPHLAGKSLLPATAFQTPVR